jgi:hypothetical protein
VGKTSGSDLFFGSNPRYKRADLKIYPFKYKNLTDTLPVIMSSSATHSAFIFSIKPSRDTILIKIADTQMDTLTYTVKRPSGACAPYTIEQAHLNSGEMVQEQRILIMKK